MIIRSVLDIPKVHDFILGNDKIAYDIETTGLEPRTDKIIGFGFSNESEGFYIVHLEWDGDKLVEVVPYSVCVEIISLLQHKKWIGWNGSFEVRFTRHYLGIDLADSMYSDGMLAVHTVDENRRNYRLKDIGEELFGEEAVEDQKLMKESIISNGGDPSCDYYKADSTLMGNYCIQDCLLTYKIDKEYVNLLEKEGLTDFYFKDEVMPLYKVVTINMEDRGIKFNIDLCEKVRSEIIIDIETLHKKIQEVIAPDLDLFNEWYLNKELPVKKTGDFGQYLCILFDLDLPKTKTGKFSISSKALEALEDSEAKSFLMGVGDLNESTILSVQKLWQADQGDDYIFNLSSKDHLKRLFFTKYGENPVSKTDKGNPQVDHLFLMNMEEKYEWVKDLINYNKLNKIKSTYMDRFLETHLDGVIYPSFFQHRTISGRFGSNLQQLPRPKEDGELNEVVLKYNNIIRKFFTSRDDCVFIDSDYESLEPHVFAHVSGDENLKNIFKNGHDFYSTIAIRTEKLDGVSADKKADNYLGKVNKPLRQKAKAYSLGVPYGLGDYALSKQLDIHQDEAKNLIDGYLNGFPELKKWMDNSVDQCVTKGFVKSEAGRIRHMPSAPKIWFAHKDYIMDNLLLWKRYHDSPKKYTQMKYLAKEMKNYINNSRNFQIQSLSASITNRACIAINRELKRKGINGSVIAQIHDQIIVEVPKKDAEECRKMVQFLMENVYKLSLKLKAPAEIGLDFSDAH